MSTIPRSAVLCTTCRSIGILEDGHPCHVCEGPGSFHRLVVPIKIVAASDLDPVPDILFQRMAITSASHRGDRVMVRGVTDRGLCTRTAMSIERWANAPLFSLGEEGRWF